MQVVTLNNGITLPLIGLGTNTFGKVNNHWHGEINFETKEIESALRLGYTFLDTAIVYRNEAVVGLAYKKAKVLRHHVFLQTKLPSSGLYIKDEEAIREAIGESLHKLSTSYIDVVLMHQPRPKDEENLKIYRVLEKLVDEGKIITIGVSNFSIEQLDYLLKHARIKPSINQIEIHPGYWNEDLIAFCQKNHVIVQAWSPLFRTSDADRLSLIEIGKKYQKSWAQIVIRYLVEQGVMVITKSHEPARQLENISVFDFSLSEEDKVAIKAMNHQNFPKLAILGGTGFVGVPLTMEGLRLGFDVINVSRHAKFMPQRHLTLVKADILEANHLSDELKDVDTLICTLNDTDGVTYFKLHQAAINLARQLNKPLIIMGSYVTLMAPDLSARLYDQLNQETKDKYQGHMNVFDYLISVKDVKWTYISPSPIVSKFWLHHDYNIGGNILLKDNHGNSENSVIDLVNFALEVADNQNAFNQQHLTIANR